jgi:decaprenylphospho-beta-D-erythro-pentofuranosid-2-ulose 2-reductase
MNVVILGATKGIGRAVARRMAERGDTLCLLGRDETDLEKSAGDLEVRAGRPTGSCVTVRCDLADAPSLVQAVSRARQALGRIDAVVVTAALFGTQEQLEGDLERCRALLTVNFAHTVLFCEAAREVLLEQGGGTLCVVSSVAGDRARKPVVLYGATKAGLSYYLEGLDHRYHARGLHVVTIKPGFVKTSMTQGLKPPPFAGTAEQVARDIVAAIDRKTPVVYTPWAWRWVMHVIRRLPRGVMRQIGF